MTTFTLTIFDEERSVLSTQELLSPEHLERVREAFERWKKQGGVVIISDCLVKDVRQTTLELDVEPETWQEARDRLSGQVIIDGDPK